MSTIYVNSILIDPVTFINNQTIVNVNCSNRKWVDNGMYAAFYLCHNLQSVTGLNDNVTDISGAFYECNNLTNIPSIPNSVTNMSGTFYHCTKLTNIPAIPSNISNAAYTFAGCSNLTTTPNLPDTITNMWGTFGDCINLTSITQIPNVTSLPVTYANTGITDLPIIPDSVTDLSGTFMMCQNLGDLLHTTNKLINNTNITHMNATFYNSSITSTPALPSSVVYMANTFAECKNLITKSGSIPSSLTYMQNCFKNCTSLESAWPISSSQNVENLADCYSGCTNLTSIGYSTAPIPNTVTNLYNTFSNCTSLINAAYFWPNSATTLYRTFAGCTNLSKIYHTGLWSTSYQSSTTPYASSLSSGITNITECFDGCSNLDKIILPNTITIMDNAFRGCTNLSGIAIQSENVISINNSFANTSSRKDIYIIYKNTTTNLYTTTYNTFISAGYDENGTKDNIYLHDYPRIEYDSTKYTIYIQTYTYASVPSEYLIVNMKTSENTIANIANDIKYYGVN